MSNLKKEIRFPVGRIVMGSLYKASDKDADGKPRITKTGSNAGQPTQQYFFAVAFAKTPGVAHWGGESWGAEIWAIGHAAFPNIAANPAFAWKIVDGDSAVPNKKGVKPIDREGYKGHWVVSFASTYAPKVVTTDGSQYLLEAGAVMPGDFVQVLATVDGNGSTQNPGVYINHGVVRFVGYSGEGRIVTGIDATGVDWGSTALPAGMVAAPVGGAPAAPAPAAPTGAPPPPAVPGTSAAPPPPAAAPLALAPSPGFTAPPPPAAAAPPPKPARVMLPAANGATYEALIAAGWNDALLVQHAYMAA